MESSLGACKMIHRNLDPGVNVRLFHRSESRMSIARRRRGFSLVELMVVIIIIGLLSAVVTVSVRGYLITSKRNIAKLEISKIETALDAFYAQIDRYPTTSEGIQILSARSDDFPDGLLKRHPTDPWGGEYEYISPSGTDAFEIISFGRDHREGGTGEDADVSSKDLKKKSKL